MAIKTIIAKLTIWKCLLFTSLISIAFILLNNNQIHLVPSLFILPVSYVLFLFITKNVFTGKWGISIYIIEIVIFCRYVIIPLLWATDSKYNGLVVANPDYNDAVLLIAYELFILSFFVVFFVNRIFKKRKLGNKNYFDQNKKIIIYLLIALFFFIAFTNSRLRNTLFVFSLTTREDLGLKAGETLADIYDENISGLHKIFFFIGRLVLFNYLLLLVRKWDFIKIKYKITISIFLCVLYISCTWSGGLGISRWNVIIGLLLSSNLLIVLYPIYKDRIRKTSALLLVFAILLGSMAKIMTTYSKDSSIVETMNYYVNAELFDEYFSGIGPVANGIRTCEEKANYKSFEQMFVDCLNTFPYTMKILGLSNITPTGKMYHEVTKYPHIIMPNITISLFQFGWVFSPMYSILLLYLGLLFDRELMKSSSIYEKSFLLICIFWCSLFMGLNVNIINSNLVAPVIGLFIFKICNKRRKIHYEKNICNNSCI